MSRRRKRPHGAALAIPPAGEASPPDVESKWWLTHAPLVAAAVAFVVYAPSLAGGFVYDDGELILRNPSIRDLRVLRNILLYEPSRPLLTLTWALNYAWGGERAWTYHLVNVLVHAANAALLVSLFHWMALRLDRPDPRRAALLGACLFAASPMAAETVAYVASRSSALAALFSLASVRLAAGVLSGGPRSRLAPSVALFLLAALTKEEAAAVPPLLLLLDYFFVSGQRWSELKRRAWIHACFVGLLLLGALARRFMTGSWLPPSAVPTGLYLLTQWAAFPLYFLRALLPVDPALYRGHLLAAWPPGATTVLWALVTFAMVAVAVRERRRRPEWSFAVACLATGLLPSSSLVALNEMVVDHRAYLGSAGIAFAAGGLLWRLGRWKLGLIVVALFALRSVSYEWVLADPVRAWEDAVQRSPGSADALTALGESYAERGDPRAEATFLRAVQLGPDNYRYWANLGVYYSDRGKYLQAESALRTAAGKAPGEATVRDFLGQVLRALGREDEAVAEYEAAIAADPRFAQAYINLAEVSLRRGQAERARTLLDQATPITVSAEEGDAIARLRRELP